MDFVPDIPRIYTAIAEWAACMVYVLVMKKRLKNSKLIVFSLCWLVAFCVVQTINGKLPLIFWIPGMAVAMLMMCLCIITLGGARPIEAMFWTARAFVLAEFAASIEWQFFYYFRQQFVFGDQFIFPSVFLAVIYSWVFCLAFFIERRYLSPNMQQTFARKDIYSSVGIALTIFLISNVSFIDKNTPISGRYASEIFYIRTLVNLCGLILLIAQQEQRLWLHAKLELDSIKNVLSRQYEQYCLSKDNLELLNRRHHDLKHQIQIIRNEQNPEKKAQYLDDLERGLKTYEAQIRTGNSVLDTILTTKSMFCMDNNINFTCVADGTLLDFIDVMDICSILGNALDNAIESSLKIADLDKRIIKMAIFAQNNLLMLRFENYVETSPSFENGLPITTKPDPQNHGYGIKSIRYAVEKYDGSVSISVTDNWFSLWLLIPLGGGA